MNTRSPRTSAFTLIELAIVILVLSLLAAAAFRYSANVTNANNTEELNKTFSIIETALQNYRNIYNRIPCPSDLTLAENVAGFGVEVGTAGDGLCTGYNFINSSADPDSADAPLYDSATSSKVVAGAVPTKTLKIDDKYAYDPWGRKILFAPDKRYTTTGAFNTYNTASGTGAVVIKKTAADTLANSITYNGVYALVSFGQNGHGGYVRNPTATSTRFNAGSTNTDELKNCHCDNTSAATSFDRIFVQKGKTDTTTLTNMFDDVVRFRTRLQMASYSELQ